MEDRSIGPSGRDPGCSEVLAQPVANGAAEPMPQPTRIPLSEESDGKRSTEVASAGTAAAGPQIPTTGGNGYAPVAASSDSSVLARAPQSPPDSGPAPWGRRNRMPTSPPDPQGPAGSAGGIPDLPFETSLAAEPECMAERKPTANPTAAEAPEMPGIAETSSDFAGDVCCPACDCAEFRALLRATDRLYRTTAKTFLIVECKRCRLIRLHPAPSARELRDYYPKSYWFEPAPNAADRLTELYREFVLRDHVPFVWKALEKAGPRGPLLDVGCGGGLFLRLMAARGVAVAGLDFSIDAAVCAWRANGVPATCGSLSHAPFGSGTFACITMFHVLEHLYDPGSHVVAARDLLRPEGRLVAQVPNAGCWQFLLLGEKWNGLDAPRHLFDFRDTDLEILLDQCGLEVMRRKYFSLRDNPTGLATSLAPWLDPMARRVRGVEEGPRLRLFKHLLYLALVVTSLPFTLLEAACRAGSTVMVEARKKS